MSGGASGGVRRRLHHGPVGLSRFVRRRPDLIASAVGDELFELLDGESDASTDPNRYELVRPDQLIDRGTTHAEGMGCLRDVDEEGSLSGRRRLGRGR